MDPGTNRFDSELQMFVEQIRDVDLDRLRFLRWLAERGRLEHEVAGASVGEYRPEGLTEHPVVLCLAEAAPEQHRPRRPTRHIKKPSKGQSGSRC